MKTIKNILCLICLFTIVNLVYPQYPNRQITSNPYDQSETMIAVNPVNNKQIVTVWNDYRSGGLFKSGYGITTDGGSTWFDDTLHICNDIPDYRYGFNPSVAMDRSGNIFYTFIAMGNDGRTASVVARKNISGGNWQYTKIQEIISEEDDMVDKPWITVDNSGGSNEGYIYVTWAKLIGNYSTVLVAQSTDHGVTFSTPYELDTQPLISGSRLVLRPSQDTSTALGNGWVQMAMPAVGPNGDAYVVWAYSNSTCNYKISKSTNGGSSWSTPVNGPSFIGTFEYLGNYPYVRNVKIIPHPSLAVGSNGNLYLAYTDKRSSDQSFRIKFASSTDGGVSWSSPIIVGEESGWQYFACLTFNQSGRLSIGYMHCNYPESNEPQQRAKMATSDNGGLTWTYETISDPASMPPLISQSASYEYMGITSIANNNQVYHLWTDHRNSNADPFFISLVEASSNLNAGWSMVSIPDTVIQPYPDHIYQILESGPFTYRNDRYEYYGWDGTYPGVGYWIKLNSNKNIKYRGVPVYKCTVSVQEDWNMIGALIQNIPASSVDFHNTTRASNFFEFQGSYFPVDTLKPGKGYWIKVDQEGTLIMDVNSTSYTPPSSSNAQPPCSPFAIPPVSALLYPEDSSEQVSVTLTLSWMPPIGCNSAVQYDIHIQNQNETDVRNYVSSDTSYTVTGLWYYTTYYWKVRGVNADSQAGDWSAEWEFVTEGAPGGDPGCPYIFGWNNKRFIADNNILPQSEYKGSEGKFVTDKYKLLIPPKLENGRYILKVKEFENEISELDNFTLIAVDHSASSEIALSPTGEIVELTIPFVVSGTLAKKLSAMDGSAVHAKSNEQHTISFRSNHAGFRRISKDTRGGILLGGWLNCGVVRAPMAEEPPPKENKVGKIISGWNGTKNPSQFTFRERMTMVYVPIEHIDNNVTLALEEPVSIDFAALAVQTLPSKHTASTLQLVSAAHSGKGDVLPHLAQRDGQNVILKPGETIQIEYEAPPLEEGKRRSFILISHGRYQHLNAWNPQLPGAFQLYQNHPNPFNPTTNIFYDLPENAHVELKVFDVLGREVATLVNEMQEAGYKSVPFNADNLSSGLYIYKLTASASPGSVFTDVKKMILIR